MPPPVPTLWAALLLTPPPPPPPIFFKSCLLLLSAGNTECGRSYFTVQAFVVRGGGARAFDCYITDCHFSEVIVGGVPVYTFDTGVHAHNYLYNCVCVVWLLMHGCVCEAVCFFWTIIITYFIAPISIRMTPTYLLSSYLSSCIIYCLVL